MGGSQPAGEVANVTRHDRQRVSPGFNFYTSGHAPEAVLMDMDGSVLHRWRYDFLDIWPDYPRGWLHTGAGFWRRAHLYENGDILAIFEGMGIIDGEERKVHFPIGIPNFMSIFLDLNPDTVIQGLNEFPEEDWPPLPLTFYPFHLMTLLGFYFAGLSVLGVFLLAVADREVRERDVLAAMAAGLAAATGAHLGTSLAWTWLTPLGAATTLALGWLLSRRRQPR